jgi:hypothetical protein
MGHADDQGSSRHWHFLSIIHAHLSAHVLLYCFISLLQICQSLIYMCEYWIEIAAALWRELQVY